MKNLDSESRKPALIPLAKQGRTIVKGKCSACGATVAAAPAGLAGSVVEQFAQHLAKRHAAESNVDLGITRSQSSKRPG